jgi:hypothetical protein
LAASTTGCWLVADPIQGHEMRFEAHTRSFAALGGVARRGIYDNMRTAADKVHKGKGRTVNARFAVMCAHYLYDADFCNVASGWEKGRVEKNVQDSRRRIWIEAARRRFGSFAELNAWLGERCRALWSEVRHPEHNQFSVAEMLEHERPHLMPMPEPFDSPQRVHRFSARRACAAPAGCSAASRSCALFGALLQEGWIPLVSRAANGAIPSGTWPEEVNSSVKIGPWPIAHAPVQEEGGQHRSGCSPHQLTCSVVHRAFDVSGQPVVVAGQHHEHRRLAEKVGALVGIHAQASQVRQPIARKPGGSAPLQVPQRPDEAAVAEVQTGHGRWVLTVVGMQRPAAAFDEALFSTPHDSRDGIACGFGVPGDVVKRFMAGWVVKHVDISVSR